MKRELIVDCKSGGTRAAVLEDGELVELHLESGAPDGQTETLYYGRVQAVRPSVHAAFVEIGQELNAFLPLEEGMKIKGGDMLIVQGVAKQTTQSKGLRVSTRQPDGADVGAHSRRNGCSYFKKSKKSGDACASFGNWKGNLPAGLRDYHSDGFRACNG